MAIILMRFGFDIRNQRCEWRRVEIIKAGKLSVKNFEKQLVEDVLMVMTVYCNKIYGKAPGLESR